MLLILLLVIVLLLCCSFFFVLLFFSGDVGVESVIGVFDSVEVVTVPVYC